MKLYLDDIELRSFSYNKSGNLIDIMTVNVPDVIEPGKYTLKVVVTDDKGYSDVSEVEVRLTDKDDEPPYLIEEKMKVVKNSEGGYDVVMLF